MNYHERKREFNFDKLLKVLEITLKIAIIIKEILTYFY